MKHLKLFLAVIFVLPQILFAQKKGEMPVSGSSPTVNAKLRSAWVLLADAKFEEGTNQVKQLLQEDPSCGLAYVFLQANSKEEFNDNLKKAEAAKLTDDEKMFLAGVKSNNSKQAGQDYFGPLLKKYPEDNYLHLWIIYNTNDKKRAIEIGEGIVKRNSKFPPAHNILGYLYMDQKDMPKAESCFNKYVSLRPDLANVYDSKGDYMMRAGKINDAIPLYEKAASMGMTVSKDNAERAKAMLKFPKPTDSEIAEVKKTIESSFDGYEKSNIEEILKPYADQSIEIYGNQMTNVGLPNLKRRLDGMFNTVSFLKEDIQFDAVNGVGTIGVALGTEDTKLKNKSTEKESERKGKVIFLLKKKQDGSWSILADHFYEPNEGETALTDDDKAAIGQVFGKWNGFAKPGETVAEKNIDELASVYSSQAVEINPLLLSNVGIGNLRARWQQLLGVKMESNRLGVIGVEGFGRKAIAWGIGTQRFYGRDSQELTQAQFPWAMILSKEKDDVWRILAIHWYREQTN